VGTLAQLPARRDAERAVSALRININAGVHQQQTVAELMTHYRKHELVPERKAASTIYVNGNFLGLYVLPKWGTMRLEGIRTVEVESWLSSLPMLPAPKAKSATSCRRCSTMQSGMSGFCRTHCSSALLGKASPRPGRADAG
jgi:hypothetical protein